MVRGKSEEDLMFATIAGVKFTTSVGSSRQQHARYDAQDTESEGLVPCERGALTILDDSIFNDDEGCSGNGTVGGWEGGALFEDVAV